MCQALQGFISDSKSNICSHVCYIYHPFFNFCLVPQLPMRFVLLMGVDSRNPSDVSKLKFEQEKDLAMKLVNKYDGNNRVEIGTFLYNTKRYRDALNGDKLYLKNSIKKYQLPTFISRGDIGDAITRSAQILGASGHSGKGQLVVFVDQALNGKDKEAIMKVIKANIGIIMIRIGSTGDVEGDKFLEEHDIPMIIDNSKPGSEKSTIQPVIDPVIEICFELQTGN